MGYLKKAGFEYDIFISYSTKNDKRKPKGAKNGWITEVKEQIVQDFEDLTGDELSIWFDKNQIITGDNLEGTISDDIKKCATILIFLSEPYLKSPWCELERNLFMNHLSETDSNRIFVVTLNRSIEDRIKNPKKKGRPIPKALQDIHRTKFFDEDEGNRFPYCYKQMNSESSEMKKFITTIENLADDIRKQLDRIDNQIPLPDTPSTKPDTNSDSGSNREYYETRCKDCDGLIIVYGEGKEAFVSANLAQSLRQMPERKQRRKDEPAGCIIDPPPEPGISKQTVNPEVPYMARIDCSKGISQKQIDALESYFDNVKTIYENQKIKNPRYTEAYPWIVLNATGHKDRLFAEEIRTKAKEMDIVTYLQP